MAGNYSVSQIVLNSFAASPSYDILAYAANAPAIIEFGIALGVATASTYGIGRPANDGSQVQSGQIPFLPENSWDPPSQTYSATLWTVAPTSPIVFARRAYIIGAIDAAVIWTFPRGYILNESRGLVLWNIAASAALTHVWAIINE